MRSSSGRSSGTRSCTLSPGSSGGSDDESLCETSRVSLFSDFNTMAPPETRCDEGPARAPGVPDLRRLYLKPSSTTTSRCAFGVAAPRWAGAGGAAWRGRGFEGGKEHARSVRREPVFEMRVSPV